MRRRDLFTLPALLTAQEPEVDFICPMDRDVHSKAPGKCPRCGMGLVAGLPDPVEYPVELAVLPRRVRPGEPVKLLLRIGDPKSAAVPVKLQLIHERLFHLFVIGPGLDFFAHEHPELQPDGSFALSLSLPSAGDYRLLCDFYPERGTPQMVTKTLLVPGAWPARKPLRADLSPRQTGGVRLSLETEPTLPIAAQRARLVFRLDPVLGFEPFLGAWGHLLISSGDRQDLIHTHPFLAYPERGHLQFNVIFPRPGVHRVWLQVQQSGEVRTVHFDVPVARLS